MPIIMTPVDTAPPAGGTDVCSGTGPIVKPDQPLHNGCPVLTKTPSITIPAGSDATIEWVIRDSSGQPVNICGCIEDDGNGNVGKVMVRIKPALDPCAAIYEFEATVTDCASGTIQFTLPEEIKDNACIYVMEVGLYNQAGSLVAVNKGLLSIERSLFADTSCPSCGPITLEEVRLQLRDILAENDMIEDVEFDDIDIIHSMMQPIRFWNEIPPDLVRFNACNFPYHGAWLKATCSNLLRTIATWYERNNAKLSGGGVSSGRRDKLNPYLLQARTYEDEWKEFVERKKIEINANDMYGSDWD